MKRYIRSAVLGLALAATSVGVQALPIGLGLVIDGSGSIFPADFSAQKTGYVAALNAVLPTDGSVAVGVYQFSSGAQVEFGFQVINGAGDLAALVAAINGMTQIGFGTVIGDGIDLAASQMNAFGYGNLEKAIIDVSTDGLSAGTPLNNANAFVAAAAATASGEGNVNCLGIGPGANCSFIAGPNSFSVNSSNFAIQQALEDKIRRELGVPEPGTVLMLGFGLIGLALRQRMKAA